MNFVEGIYWLEGLCIWKEKEYKVVYFCVLEVLIGGGWIGEGSKVGMEMG